MFTAIKGVHRFTPNIIRRCSWSWIFVRFKGWAGVRLSGTVFIVEMLVPLAYWQASIRPIEVPSALDEATSPASQMQCAPVVAPGI